MWLWDLVYKTQNSYLIAWGLTTFPYQRKGCWRLVIWYSYAIPQQGGGYIIFHMGVKLLIMLVKLKTKNFLLGLPLVAATILFSKYIGELAHSCMYWEMNWFQLRRDMLIMESILSTIKNATWSSCMFLHAFPSVPWQVSTSWWPFLVSACQPIMLHGKSYNLAIVGNL